MKRFDKMKIIETLPVSIIENPFKILEQALSDHSPIILESGAEEKSFRQLLFDLQKPNIQFIGKSTVYLRLYSYKKDLGKYVPEGSGLNQWNASGRKRDIGEVYIPVPAKVHKKAPGFFPDRDTPFALILPNGQEMSAKICQAGNKALMSNPNKALGEWLLRDLLKLGDGELLTYQKLEMIGIDSVQIEKVAENRYQINFAKIGSYEAFIGEESEEVVFEDD